MRFSENNKEKQLRRIKSTVTQSQVQEPNDGHPLGKMLSGKMLAPSPAFQKALLGAYSTLSVATMSRTLTLRISFPDIATLYLQFVPRLYPFFQGSQIRRKKMKILVMMI